MTKKNITTVLFDLDGTLLDTAPDLAFAINKLLELNNLPRLPFTVIRPWAGHGGKGLIKLGFSIEETDLQFEIHRQEFLNLYFQHLCVKTTLFPGMENVLNYLKENKLIWGIVTNKPGWLTEPLLKQLNLFDQAACVVSGDTLTKRKPDPAPLLHACDLLNVSPGECVYVGDAERDIQAGKSAGMHTLIAQWGYIFDTDPFDVWGADAVIKTPENIIDWLVANATLPAKL